MDLNETAVENEDFDTEADDALPESVEETDESESESLESITESFQESEEKPQEQQASEPGYVKLRVEKAVQKAIAETERRMRAEFDQQMAPIREKMLNDEARSLVQQGEFKSLDRAKEYLQLKQGLPVSQQQTEPQEQPRNSNGQYAPKQQDAGTSTRVDMLAHQADRIKERTGIDVIAEFNSNEEIKKKVINGEMDFYDVAEAMKAPRTKKPPAPMRSPNGASGSVQPNAITNMSDEQFERMERKIREGARYSLR